MLDIFLQIDTWIALFTLCVLEIILGIDNIIFISIVSNAIPEEKRRRVRNIGLFLTMIIRVLFLLCITWIIGFSTPLFTLSKNFIIAHEISFSGKDLILGIGGIFLIAKSTIEMTNKVDDAHTHTHSSEIQPPKVSVIGVIVQIILLDLIFSFDSILTAVGMVDHVSIMIIAVIVSIAVMIISSESISKHIKKHPSLEILALGFLILIGFSLLLEAFHKEVPKEYIYFSIAFSLTIEMINIRVKSRNRKRSSLELQKKIPE